MINIKEYEQFNFFDTLKNTSVDKHDRSYTENMTNCENEVVDFDKVKDNYIKNLRVKEAPKSNDALFIDKDNHIIFVEFKNGFIDKPKQYAIRKKIYDSLLIFSDITVLCIGRLRESARYILVYNEEANANNPDIPREVSDKEVQNSTSFDNIAKGFRSYSKDEYILFGIDIFEKYCFKSVHTYTKQEFEKYTSKIPLSVKVIDET